MSADHGFQKVSLMIDLLETGRTPIVTFRGVEQRYAFNVVHRMDNGLVKGEGDNGDLYFSATDVAVVFVKNEN